ncbi:hypothetical protein HX017_06865 [Myroides marinus]|uniref:hypothetical protein n=1 Tax=Myroides marinus TaxID=703342 RepID=UPI000741C25E|nr:hypothetical protein [Myroides marinus]KUF43922.1 hypothetical protein AS361_04645 [Myroides marinus]MDM1349703.1 hypothetical protein [Myroides marinus]MDM1353648.1 hypothetical protein [Myroides marinus]MDM1356912.1 hypothetical protein [Myroides marinus]MDM1361698.1 hypothetical protein [Myroides marinus]
MSKYYIVTYQGAFGFIKPWTAVRDSEVFSQQFLTPSIVEGIEKKLFPELLSSNGIHKIVRHRLSYDQISEQQEVTQTRGWNSVKKGKQFLFERNTSILLRGVMINPILHLVFKTEEEAKHAFSQHICLCRNEDILLPVEINEVSSEVFESDEYPGYELMFEKCDKSFIVGYNRYSNDAMYGWLNVIGTPVKSIRE